MPEYEDSEELVAMQREYRSIRVKKPSRVGVLDELRGLCILLMVVYHGAYDLVYLFGMDIRAFHSPVLDFLQPFVAGIFVFVSGIACRYSRSNLRRGGIALGLGLALTLVTHFLLLPYLGVEGIYFGILHLLGSGMLLFGLLHRGLDKLHPFLGFVLFGALFAVLWGVPRGYVGFPPRLWLSLPQSLYSTSFLFPLGLPHRGFASTDYFPLVPWVFLFLAGAYFGRFFQAGDMPKALYKTHIPFLAKVGRYTLLIYILHQPVVFGLLWLVFRGLSLLGIGS